MSDRTWNRLLGGMTVWALIGLWPILVFLIGAWVLWFMIVMFVRLIGGVILIARAIL